MGGSSGSGIPLRDVARLQEEARRTIRREAEPGKQCVFISFVAEDGAEVNAFRAQAKNEASDIEFNDWSVKLRNRTIASAQSISEPRFESEFGSVR